MTFEDWLRDRVEERSAVGDLARDTANDPDWPADAGHYEQHAYLEQVGAIPAALDAHREARQRWRNERRARHATR
ncbi:MAG: hypothetical protein WD232_08425 [Acidimicrobiales bacterium]